MLLYTIHQVYEDRLFEVTAEMKELGSPSIRVVNVDNEYWQAIEGTHRLAAACALNIPVDFLVIESHELIEADTLDVDHGYFCKGESYTAAEIAGELWPGSEKNAVTYKIKPDNRLEIHA